MGFNSLLNFAWLATVRIPWLLPPTVPEENLQQSVAQVFYRLDAIPVCLPTNSVKTLRKYHRLVSSFLHPPVLFSVSTRRSQTDEPSVGRRQRGPRPLDPWQILMFPKPL